MRDSTRCVLIAALAAFASPRPAAASSCVPGFDYGAFGKDSVDYGGSSGCDKWNSASATCTSASPVKTGTTCYSATVSTGCNLGTDGTTSGAMTLHGTASSVFGNVYYGNGGTTADLTVHGHPSYVSSGALAAPLVLPSVSVPTQGTNNGACASCAITAGNMYTTVSGTVTFPAGTYVVDTLTAQVVVNSGPVIIYVTTAFSGSVTNNTGVPGNLVFMVASAVSSIALPGGFYGMYAPDTTLDLHGHSDVYGSVVGSTVTISGTPAIHYDAGMASTVVGNYNCTVAPTEISRSSPIVASLNSGATYVVQGSFEKPSGTATTINSHAAVAAFAFPFEKGHLRARLASTITTTGSTYSSGTILFDAGATGKIPTANNAGCTTFNGTCRHIFTNTNAAATTGTTFHPTMTTLSDSTSATVGGLITAGVAGITAADNQTIVETVLASKLGGVDRSTAAVIGASTYAGVTTRPTIAYVGATDGMLHAICASTGGTTPSGTSICPSLGTELWAFIPRTELPLIATNTSRLDGSPRVLDAFGDFTNNPATGTKSWHTILTFHIGSIDAGTAAAYAIDVTDPANPTVLWELTAPTTVAANDFGSGLIVAAGPVIVAGAQQNLAVLETNNGGSAGSGVTVTAVYLETGAKAWQFGYTYPTPPRSSGTDPSVPTTGIPGGVVGVDLTGYGSLTDFVGGDLYGNVWRLSASDGTSRNGTNEPLFSFTTNLHPIGAPPAIYSSGGTQYAAFATGGYWDPSASTWTTNTQYLIAVKLSSTAATISESSTACSTCVVGVNQTITSGDQGFSQALVVGTQLLVTTDTTDVTQSTYGTGTNTGHLITVDLTGATATSTVVINSGGSSIANSGTTLYSSSAGQQQVMASNATTTTGTKVDITAATKVKRDLWLRTQ